MGRVKKYSAGTKHRRSKSVVKKLGPKGNDSSDDNMSDNGASTTTVLSVNKRKQIFKKSKEGRREVKKQILELKRQTSKLRKRNLDQKSEKKVISKQIKKLREKMRNCDVEQVNSDVEGDDQWVDIADEEVKK